MWPADIMVVKAQQEVDRKVKGPLNWPQVWAARARGDRPSRSEVLVQNEGSLFVKKVHIP